MTANIQVHQLCKTYDIISNENYALNNISLEINEGERLGIIGENGAGKSTFLRILAGLLQPTAGTIKIKGKLHSLLSLGLGFKEDLSGRQNIYLQGELIGKSKEDLESEIDLMIEFSELKEFIDYPIRTYSSGMKAKLAFTSAVYIEPEILLIDETLSVGDKWFVEKAKNKIKMLCNTGKIVIIVSHSMEAIINLCNRCVWIQNGKIEADGCPKKVTMLYKNEIRKKRENYLKNKFIIQTAKINNNLYLKEVLIGSQSCNSLSRIIVKEGEELDILIKTKPIKESCSIYLFIESFDGIALFNEEIMLNLHTKLLENTIKLFCGKIRMRPGYYKCSLELKINNQGVDKISTLFIVESDFNNLMGGNPLLRWPMLLQTKKISSLVSIVSET